jgi:hypothetical protein
MKKTAKTAQRVSRQKSRGRSRAITWIIVAGVVGLIGYGLMNLSSVAYDEDDIKVVRFDLLDAKQKNTALEAANTARCTCGCGMTLAQCVATDMTCPVRDGNIEKIKTMVREAMTPPSS